MTSVVEQSTRAAGILVGNFEEDKNKITDAVQFLRTISVCDVEISSSAMLQEGSIFEKVHLLVNCGVKDLQSGKDYHRLICFVSAFWDSTYGYQERLQRLMV